MLTERDIAESREWLIRRDAHNRRLYGEIAALQSDLDRSFAGRLFNTARRVLGRLRAR